MKHVFADIWSILMVVKLNKKSKILMILNPRSKIEKAGKNNNKLIPPQNLNIFYLLVSESKINL